MTKAALWLASTGIAATLSASAVAQTAPPAATPVPTASAPATTTAPAPSTRGLNDIIVTAQRRSENIQKAPIAIDAVSAATLKSANITEADGISQIVPSTHIGKASGPYVLFYVRGVGSNASSSLTDTAISLSLDGVPLARQYDTVGQFYDLERVEVLEGPQGTLYGRNATGGAVNIIPNHPKPDFGADFNLTIGDYNTINADASVNLPVNDLLSTRFSFASANHSGYLSDGGADEDLKSARAQFLFKPSSTLSVLISGDVVKQGGVGGGSAIDSNGFVYWQRIGLTDPRIQAIEAAKGFQVIPESAQFEDNRYYGLHGEINWTTDLGTLTIIPAYRHNDLNFGVLYGAYSTVKEHDRQESVEARFATRDIGPLKVIVGGYYMHDGLSTTQTVNQLNKTGNQQIYDYFTDTKAVFADATFKLTDKLRLIGGVRWTTESKGLDGSLHNPFLANPTYISIDQSNNYSDVTYRAGAQYDITPTSMAYATISTGFHSGGYFFTADNPVFKPEYITAYTLGIKNRFFDNKLQFNVELFKWNYKDQQLGHTAVDSMGNAIFATQNAGATHIKGVEVNTQYRILSNTQIGVYVQYLDSKFIQYSYVQPTAGSPLSLCSSTKVSGGFDISCQGLTPPNSPKWTVNPSITQTVPISDDLSLDLNATGHYESQSYTTVTYQPSDHQPAYFTGNLSATLNIRNKWSVGAFIDNVANSTIKEFTTHTNFNSSFLQPPRTFGFRVSAHFD
jgi:iron complex outermembrane receptor protein